MQMFMQIEQSLKQKNQKEMYMRNMSNLLENRDLKQNISQTSSEGKQFKVI